MEEGFDYGWVTSFKQHQISFLSYLPVISVPPQTRLPLINRANIQVVKVLFCFSRLGLKRTPRWFVHLRIDSENVDPNTSRRPSKLLWFRRFLAHLQKSHWSSPFLWQVKGQEGTFPSFSEEASVLLSVRHVEIILWEIRFRSRYRLTNVHFKALQKAETRTQSALMHSSVGVAAARLAHRLTKSAGWAALQQTAFCTQSLTDDQQRRWKQKNSQCFTDVDVELLLLHVFCELPPD